MVKTEPRMENMFETEEAEHLRKLFIGGLDHRTTDEKLKNYFEQWGTIVDVVVMKDPKTKRSRGFGFITYSNSSMVDDAQANRPHKIDGKVVEPKRAIPRGANNPEVSTTVKKIFVANIKDDVNEEDIKEFFYKYGNVLSVTLVVDKDTGKKRGFGFVEFDDYDTVDRIVLKPTHILNGRKLDIKKALSKAELAKIQEKPAANNNSQAPPTHGGHGGQTSDWNSMRGGYGGQIGGPVPPAMNGPEVGGGYGPPPGSHWGGNTGPWQGGPSAGMVPPGSGMGPSMVPAMNGPMGQSMGHSMGSGPGMGHSMGSGPGMGQIGPGPNMGGPPVGGGGMPHHGMGPNNNGMGLGNCGPPVGGGFPMAGNYQGMGPNYTGMPVSNPQIAPVGPGNGNGGGSWNAPAPQNSWGQSTDNFGTGYQQNYSAGPIRGGPTGSAAVSNRSVPYSAYHSGSVNSSYGSASNYSNSGYGAPHTTGARRY